MKPTWNEFKTLVERHPWRIYMFKVTDGYLLLGGNATVAARVLQVPTIQVELDNTRVKGLLISTEEFGAVVGELKRNLFGITVEVIEDELSA